MLPCAAPVTLGVHWRVMCMLGPDAGMLLSCMLHQYLHALDPPLILLIECCRLRYHMW